MITWSRPRRPVLVLVLVVVLAGLGGGWVYSQRHRNGQAMAVPGGAAYASAPWPRPAPGPRPAPSSGGSSSGGSSSGGSGTDPAFATSVGPDGRYFLDQHGRPFLVRGDSPWALLTRLPPDQAARWFADRRSRGVNAAIISLIGAPGNGGPSDDGGTVDGLRPFLDGDVLAWQQPYWQRVVSYLRMAADAGITVFLYPIDGWTIGHSFVPTSIEQCREYGTKVADRLRELPNIVWMSGGDYFPATSDPALGSDVDHCIDAMMRGIRGTGDVRPFSIQLGYQKSLSTDDPYWAQRVDWNFVYSYYPTYRAVLDAYARRPALPAVLGEANYQGENNQPDTPPTTDLTLRRQVLWALTSGASGEFAGSRDWTFDAGWQQRLGTPAMDQIGRLRDLFATLSWWQLVPDVDGRLVTAGRGTPLTTDRPEDVLQDDYVTAARTPDGRTAVVYLPGPHTVTVDPAELAPGGHATWVDPVSGARRPATPGTSFSPPGANAGGDHDWLLLFTA